MKVSFEGQHALITGAGRGIGKTTTKALYDAGAKITAVDLSLESLQKLQEEVR